MQQESLLHGLVLPSCSQRPLRFLDHPLLGPPLMQKHIKKVWRESPAADLPRRHIARVREEYQVMMPPTHVRERIGLGDQPHLNTCGPQRDAAQRYTQQETEHMDSSYSQRLIHTDRGVSSSPFTTGHLNTQR